MKIKLAFIKRFMTWASRKEVYRIGRFLEEGGWARKLLAKVKIVLGQDTFFGLGREWQGFNLARDLSSADEKISG